MDKKLMEIRWHGRGGQGAKTASLLLAEAAFNAGMYIQGFPEYGPERMGAPITAYNRIANFPLRVHSNIYEPDYVVVVDETLLKTGVCTKGLKKEGGIIVNTKKTSDEIRKELDGYEGKVYTVNARKISEEALGAYFPNIPMLGAIVKVTNIIDEDKFINDMEGSFKHKFERKPHFIPKNMEALKRGIREVGELTNKMNVNSNTPWTEVPRGGMILAGGNAVEFNTGWIQIYSENTQEAYDNFIQAVKVAENEKVMVPAMVCYDGFITSHAVENITMIDDSEVKKFVGENKRTQDGLLGKDSIAIGPMVLTDFYMEMKRNQLQGLLNAKEVLLEVSKEYEELTGRKYGLFEEYRLIDADIAMIIVGSSAGTGKKVVDDLREKGIKAGLLKIRLYRPFPGKEIAKALNNLKAIAVMDKAEGLSGNEGPIFTDVSGALYGELKDTILISYIYGLGGRDVRVEDLEKVFMDLKEATETGKYSKYNYLSLRE